MYVMGPYYFTSSPVSRGCRNFSDQYTLRPVVQVSIPVCQPVAVFRTLLYPMYRHQRQWARGWAGSFINTGMTSLNPHVSCLLEWVGAVGATWHSDQKQTKCHRLRACPSRVLNSSHIAAGSRGKIPFINTSLCAE